MTHYTEEEIEQVKNEVVGKIITGFHYNKNDKSFILKCNNGRQMSFQLMSDIRASRLMGAPPVAQGQKIKRYQYVREFVSRDYNDPTTCSEEDALEKAGDDGWLLCAKSSPDSTGITILYFAREL